MKKILATLLCITCIALSGCSVEVSDMKSEYLTSSFDGVWRQVDYNSESYLEAIIKDGIITINMMKDDEIVGVYWYGNVPALTGPVSDYQWVSDVDISKIHQDLVYLSDKEKHFIYINGRLWFPYSMSDYSIIMRLERVEE